MNTPDSTPTLRWRLGIALLCALLTFWSASRINSDSIKGDATQNLKIAYNLFHNSNFAVNLRHPELARTSFREPLPPAYTALYAKLVLPEHVTGNFEAWHNGEFTRAIKLGNLTWVFAGLFGLWLLAWRQTRSHPASLVALALAYLYFFDNPGVINSLYTELQTGVLMIWCAVLLMQALETQRIGHAVLAGLMVGMLSLTKSLFFVAGPAVLLLAWGLWWWRAPAGSSRTALLHLALPALAAFALVVTPWMLRNQHELGTTELSSGRAGYVMFKRALMDRMSDAEFRLGFDLYGPQIYKDAVAGTGLAIRLPEDMERGGRLQWLNPYLSSFQAEDNQAIYAGRPDLSLTYYRKAAAVYRQVKRILVQGGHPRPDLTADQIMKSVAMQTMLEHPVDHLKVSLLLFWRGFWWAPHNLDRVFPVAMHIDSRWGEAFNALAGVSLFAAFVGFVLRRNTAGVALTALPVVMIAMHTLLTQNLPRFTIPAIPFMLLSLVVLVHAGVSRVRLRPGLAPGMPA
jgi:hypothetical protein